MICRYYGITSHINKECELKKKDKQNRNIYFRKINRSKISISRESILYRTSEAKIEDSTTNKS